MVSVWCTFQKHIDDEFTLQFFMGKLQMRKRQQSHPHPVVDDSNWNFLIKAQPTSNVVVGFGLDNAMASQHDTPCGEIR